MDSPAIVVTYCIWTGFMTIERIQSEKRTNKVLPVRGIYEVRENVAPMILVPNLSKRSVVLPKNMMVAIGTEPLER